MTLVAIEILNVALIAWQTYLNSTPKEVAWQSVTESTKIKGKYLYLGKFINMIQC